MSCNIGSSRGSFCRHKSKRSPHIRIGVTICSFQRLIGVSAVVFSVAHAATTFLNRGKLHPFTRYGWNAEHYQLAFFLGMLGLLLVHSARAPSRGTSPSLGISLILALFSFALFMRYFWISLAVFALAGFANALAVHYKPPGVRPFHWWFVSALLSLLLIVTASFILFSFFSRGN